MKKILFIAFFISFSPTLVFAASSIVIDPVATVIPAQFTNASIKINCAVGHNWAVYTPADDGSIFSDRESCGSTYYSIGNRIGDWQVVEYNPKIFVGSFDDISKVRKNKAFIGEAKYNVSIGEASTKNVMLPSNTSVKIIPGSVSGNLFLIIIAIIIILGVLGYFFKYRTHPKIGRNKKKI